MALVIKISLLYFFINTIYENKIEQEMFSAKYKILVLFESLMYDLNNSITC